MNFSFEFESSMKINSKDSLKLKRLIQRDFPYDRMIKKLSSNSYNLLFDKELWKFLLKISAIYTGEEIQKRNEIAFAAWTTLLRVYGSSRVRGGKEQLEILSVASVVLQSKLLEESDVDLMKLTKLIKSKKLTNTNLAKNKIESSERKICSLLEWKLLVPSPQVILFSSLDALNLPSNLKLLVSKVLDKLIQDFLLHEYLIEGSQNGNNMLLSKLVVSVIEIVLCDFFSVFKSVQIDVKKFLNQNLSLEASNLNSYQREKIEKALETVMKFQY